MPVPGVGDQGVISDTLAFGTEDNWLIRMKMEDLGGKRAF
jgi:hypothetical protein